MSKQVIDTGLHPEVVLDECQGDLQVRGWEAPQVAAQADSEALQLEHADESVRIRCNGDLSLHLPGGADLSIGRVQGDADLKFMQAGLTIGEISGDLNLRQLAACRGETLYGDLSAKHIAEDLVFAMVHGDVDARQIQGDCVLGEVKGNLDLQSVDGGIRAHTKGNARLRLSRLNGTEYQIDADGNLYCYLPEDAGARIVMHSNGHVIKVRLPQGSTTYQQSDYEMTLGEGGLELRLSSGGSVYLFIEKPGWPEAGAGGFDRVEGAGLPEDYGRQIAQQVEAQIQSQMSEVTRRINEQMNHLSDRLGRAGFSPDEAERIVDQARRSGEQESARAQEKMRRAQEKLERKLEAHRRRSDQRAQAAVDRRTRRQSWGFEWPAPPPPPAPPAPPKPQVSEEERLIILRMLEQKKISLEEADNLLSALEGGE